jgi:hypothetical protein
MSLAHAVVTLSRDSPPRHRSAPPARPSRDDPRKASRPHRHAAPRRGRVGAGEGAPDAGRDRARQARGEQGLVLPMLSGLHRQRQEAGSGVALEWHGR